MKIVAKCLIGVALFASLATAAFAQMDSKMSGPKMAMSDKKMMMMHHHTMMHSHTMMMHGHMMMHKHTMMTKSTMKPAM